MRAFAKEAFRKASLLKTYFEGEKGKILRNIDAKFPMAANEIIRLRNRVWVLDLLPEGGVGMEVGVFRGHFSELICRHAKPRKLYLVDPWTLSGEKYSWGQAYTNFGKLPTAVAKHEAETRVSRYPKTEVVVIEGLYPDCASQIQEPLDFAYLDASHKYDLTLRELKHLEDQIKPEGIILGDDWSPNPKHKHHGVYLAVTQFMNENGWKLIDAGRGGQWAIRRKA
jgi:hypothetical protein